MQVVYFGQDLNARAPDSVGCLCEAPEAKWVTIFDVIAAIEAGENVAVRPASESEMRRAEAHVALYEIGWLLGQQMQTLLDQETDESVASKMAALHSGLESIDIQIPSILDCEGR